jgi:hypothetical protein
MPVAPLLAAVLLLAPLSAAPTEVVQARADDAAGESAGGALRASIAEYQADRGALRRLWNVPLSTEGRTRLQALGEAWLERLDGMDFDALDAGGRVDWLLLRNGVGGDLRLAA